MKEHFPCPCSNPNKSRHWGARCAHFSHTKTVAGEQFILFSLITFSMEGPQKKKIKRNQANENSEINAQSTSASPKSNTKTTTPPFVPNEQTTNQFKKGKRKAESTHTEDTTQSDNASNEPPKKQKKQKQVQQNAQADQLSKPNTTDGTSKSEQPQKTEVHFRLHISLYLQHYLTYKTAQKHRYILFLGNVSLFATKEQIQAHFDCISKFNSSFAWLFCVPSTTVVYCMTFYSLERAGKVVSIRMLTEKGTGKFRGAAFIEFSNNEAYSVRYIRCIDLINLWCAGMVPYLLFVQIALKMHHTELCGKKINVEATAGNVRCHAILHHFYCYYSIIGIIYSHYYDCPLLIILLNKICLFQQ